MFKCKRCGFTWGNQSYSTNENHLCLKCEASRDRDIEDSNIRSGTLHNPDWVRA